MPSFTGKTDFIPFWFISPRCRFHNQPRLQYREHNITSNNVMENKSVSSAAGILLHASVVPVCVDLFTAVVCLTLQKQNLWWSCWVCFFCSRVTSCLTCSARASVIRGSDRRISATKSSGFVLQYQNMIIYCCCCCCCNFRWLDGKKKKKSRCLKKDIRKRKKMRGNGNREGFIDMKYGLTNI